MTKLIKYKLKKRSKLAKKYLKNGKTENDLDNLNIIPNECTKLILDSIEKHAREMSDWMTASLYQKSIGRYWTVS